MNEDGWVSGWVYRSLWMTGSWNHVESTPMKSPCSLQMQQPGLEILYVVYVFGDVYYDVFVATFLLGPHWTTFHGSKNHGVEKKVGSRFQLVPQLVGPRK